MRTRNRRLLCLALCLAGSVAGTAAQESPPGELPSGGSETVEVDLRTIPFYAVDQEGRPVYDLKAEEIEVRVDGKPVALELFEAERKSGSVPALEKPAGQEQVRRQAIRNVLFLFDLAFSTPIGLTSNRRAALGLLDELPASDQLFLLVHHTQKGFLQELGPLPADARGKAALRASIEALAPNIERVKRFADMGERPPGRRGGGSDEDVWRESHQLQIGEYREAALDLAGSLRTLAAFLGQLKGPKVLMVFSQGIDSKLYLEGSGLDSLNKLYGSVRWQPLRRDFEEPLQALAKTGTMTIFVNGHVAPGVMPDELADFRSEVDAVDLNQNTPRGDTALQEMSAAVGGLFLRHPDGTELAERLAGWTAAYYEAGFYAGKGQGLVAEGNLRLTVRRPGVRVWVPKGVKAPREYRLLTDEEKRFTVVDLVLAGPQGELSSQLAFANAWKLDGQFQPAAAAPAAAGGQRRLRFEAVWPEAVRLGALDLYNVLVERGADLSAGRIVVYDRSVVSPLSGRTLLEMPVPSAGTYVWGIVAVEPTRQEIFLRRLLVEPPKERQAAADGQ